MPGDDDRLEAAIAELTQRDERLVVVAEVVGELDDLRHAAEVLAEPDAVAEPQVALVEEAVIQVEVIAERQVRDVAHAEPLDIVAVDADVVGRDLLVVADDDDLL